MSADWQSKCQPIQNQGNCGSCTAFGCTGVAEAMFKIIFLINVKLSEKDAFFCSGGSCEIGNFVEPVLNRLKYGISTEECSPYVDYNVGCGNGRCAEWYKTGFKIKSWKSIKIVADMKKALDAGPLVGVIDVYQSFMNYKSGVYHKLENDPRLGGHCIGIIGYNDELGAWKIRNSWDTSWGIAGYGYIKYGEIGIEREMWSIEPTLEKPDVEPDPGPTPSPCVVGNGTAKAMNLLPRLLRRKGRFYYMDPPEGE